MDLVQRLAPKRSRIRLFKKSINLLLYLSVLALVALAIYSLLNLPPQNSRRALYLDPLSTDFPNERLKDEVVDMLERLGYDVDVYFGSEADVRAFKSIGNYELVIIRSHGAYLKPGEKMGESAVEEYVPVIFTSEKAEVCTVTLCPHRDEILSGEIVLASTLVNKSKVYYAVTPLFLEKIKRKTLGGVVIIMSCYSLKGSALAQVLAKKGYSVIIGFKCKVSVEYMDNVLRKLLEVRGKGLSWLKAIEAVNAELEGDPMTGCLLSASVYDH